MAKVLSICLLMLLFAPLANAGQYCGILQIKEGTQNDFVLTNAMNAQSKLRVLPLTSAVQSQLNVAAGNIVCISGDIKVGNLYASFVDITD